MNFSSDVSNWWMFGFVVLRDIDKVEQTNLGQAIPALSYANTRNGIRDVS